MTRRDDMACRRLVRPAGRRAAGAAPVCPGPCERGVLRAGAHHNGGLTHDD
jgi:hypothetical protein